MRHSPSMSTLTLRKAVTQSAGPSSCLSDNREPEHSVSISSTHMLLLRKQGRACLVQIF